MAYTLQAFVGDILDLEKHAPPGAVIVSLGQGKGMIPIGDDFQELHEIPFLPLTDGGSEEIPPAIKSIAEKFKEPIAYIEAEFFGGDGTQASAVWKEHALFFGLFVNSDAINRALLILGVTKGSHFDEFEALGLGRNRDTNDWVEPSD